VLESDDTVKHRLLERVLKGADEQTAKAIVALGEEMTVYRLLVTVAKLEPQYSQGLLVMKYGVKPNQAKAARKEANKKSTD